MNRFRPISFAVACALGLGLLACEDTETGDGNGNGNENTGATACSADFDCPVGQVCGDASAEGDRTCAQASANDADRVFAEASLSLTGAETYLATVYALPTDEQAPDDNSRVFKLVGVDGADSALRIAPIDRPDPGFSNDPFWTARLRYAARRREGIDRLGDAMVRGERSVFGGFETRQASSCSCSDTEICWEGSCQSSVELNLGSGTIIANVAGTVSGDSITVSVLVDANDSTSEAAALNVASTFAESADDVLFFLGQDAGHIAPLDRDESGTMTVVFSSEIPDAFSIPGLVGLFDFLDFLPESDTEASGNQADLLWVVPPSAETIDSCQTSGACTDEVTFELALATLAHEYQHLVNFARRAFDGTLDVQNRETLWLDEGLSHTIEDLVGYGNSTQEAVAQLFSDFYLDGSWAYGSDSVPQRGMAYSLLRHVIDQRARAAGASDAASSQVRTAAREVYTQLLSGSRTGYLQPLFQNLGPDGIGNWLVALYTTDNEFEVTQTVPAQYLPRATAASTFQTGFSPFAEILTSRGETIPLAGPPSGDDVNVFDEDVIDDLSSEIESEMGISQVRYFLIGGSGAAGDATIRAVGEAAVDFRLRVVRIQ